MFLPYASRRPRASRAHIYFELWASFYIIVKKEWKKHQKNKNSNTHTSISFFTWFYFVTLLCPICNCCAANNTHECIKHCKCSGFAIDEFCYHERKWNCKSNYC